VTLYHLSRRDGTPLFLHPFRKSGTTLEISQSDELRGRYGTEPRIESLTALRNDLYRRIEQDVRVWINERRFIPRFLIASAVFLVIYLFMSLVIRDPIPVADEVLIAGGVAVFAFILVGRRFEQSHLAGDRRVTLRSKVDGVVFSEDPFVHRLEALLHSVELYPKDRIAGEDEELLVEARNLKAEYPDETARVIGQLRLLMTDPRYRNLEKQMKRSYLSGKTAEAVEHGTIVPAAVTMLHVLQNA
jgi:hypothetical protein